jgi:hypothetical protein
MEVKPVGVVRSRRWVQDTLPTPRGRGRGTAGGERAMTARHVTSQKTIARVAELNVAGNFDLGVHRAEVLQFPGS